MLYFYSVNGFLQNCKVQIQDNIQIVQSFRFVIDNMKEVNRDEK